MPTETLSTIIAIVGIIGTLSGIVGFSAYFNERAKHKAVKQNKKDDETEIGLKKLEQQRIEETLRTIIKEETTSLENSVQKLTQDIGEIKSNLCVDKEATITNMRCQLKSLRDIYIGQHYADEGDRATWNELYETYKRLGGNHFKEWVNVWKEDINNLPNELKKKTSLNSRKSSGKTLLAEEK